MKKQEEIDAFSSKVVHGHTKAMSLGNNMHVMTQAPGKGKEPSLSQGLSGVNTHTEMNTGSKQVSAVIRNPTAAPIVIKRGIKVTQVVAVKRVPPVEVTPGTLERLDEIQRIPCAWMSNEHRKEMLL